MIVRSKREPGYTVVFRTTFEDERLSFEARGLLAYLLVKPDNWKISIPNLQHAGAAGKRKGQDELGRDRIYAILDELIQAGYVTREQRRSAGKVVPVDYVVYDRAPLPGIAEAENPYTENADTDNPHTENPDALKNTNPAPTTKPSKDSGAQDAPPPAVTPDANTSEESNGQPANTDRTPPPVPAAPPKRQRKPKAAPQVPAEPRPRDVYFDAFCRAFGLPDDGGKKAGLAGAFSADCKREGATIDQFRAFYRAHAGEWGKFNCTPHNVGGAFLAWRIGQGMAGDPLADAAAPEANPYDLQAYLARKAAREAADTPRFEAAL